MTYQKPFLSKQTTVPHGKNVQVNTYGGYTRGWIVNTVEPDQVQAGLRLQLIRLVMVNYDFRAHVYAEHMRLTGKPMNDYSWCDLDDDAKYDLCKLAQAKLTTLN